MPNPIALLVQYVDTGECVYRETLIQIGWVKSTGGLTAKGLHKYNEGWKGEHTLWYER